MVNYSHHLKLLLLLCPLALGLGQEELEPLHRNKRTLTTICVEIQPSGPQNEPYFMCKGADFSNGGGPQSVTQPTDQPQQSMYNYPQPGGAQMTVPQVPFPSFPSFGAGFFPASQTYENPAAIPKTTSPSSGPESHGVQYGSPAATFTPGSAPQSYGLPAVSYPTSGGPSPAARGTVQGPSPATTPTSYADAGSKKPTPAGQAAPLHKSQPSSSQTSYENAYESLRDNRNRVALDDSVLAMPNVGFQAEELNQQYRRPMEPPMMLMQFHQPTAVPHPYYDDPIMRTFYASLGHQEPQVPQEPLVAQVLPAAAAPAPSYPAPYAAAATAPDVPLPPAPPTPPPPAYPKSSYGFAASSPADGNACNSCNRPCAAPAENCPSYQPVIITMPCYGQQQPTHYLAVPSSGTSPGQAMSREPMVGHPFGGSFGMAPQVGSPFAMGQQVGGHFGMAAPQVGSPFGMGPQVGAPFGMAPVLNPFGPFGNLNPFNPFNRILGAAAPTTAQPRLRWFGGAEDNSTPTTTPTTSLPAKTSSSLLSLPIRTSTESADVSVGAAQDAAADQDNEEEDNATDLPDDAETTADDASNEDVGASKSVEKDQTFDDLVKKGEDKLKTDKRKRQNSRYSNNNNNFQKRKYVQRL